MPRIAFLHARCLMSRETGKVPLRQNELGRLRRYQDLMFPNEQLFLSVEILS
jgi:hypothetical protein